MLVTLTDGQVGTAQVLVDLPELAAGSLVLAVWNSGKKLKNLRGASRYINTPRSAHGGRASRAGQYLDIRSYITRLVTPAAHGQTSR